MSTIQDVAALAEVSVSTVSNVLNGRDDRMRPETLARVHQAIADLNYRPNLSARSLKTGHLAMLGLMLPTVANPFYGALARWVEAAAAARGYGLLFCNTYRDAAREQEYAETFFSQGVRGLILGSAMAQYQHLLPLLSGGLAVVSLDHTSANDSQLRDFVSVDNRLAGSMAVDHLLALGHRHITFVGAPAQSMNRQARMEGALAACARAGATLQVYIETSTTDRNELEMAELGRLAAHGLHAAQSVSTAFIGVNDMVAMGLLVGMRECGRAVPTDVSVIGIDGIFLGEYVSPSLSSVLQPIERIATTAVDHLIRRMKSPDIASQVTMFDPELLVRASTGPAPNAKMPP